MTFNFKGRTKSNEISKGPNECYMRELQVHSKRPIVKSEILRHIFSEQNLQKMEIL